MFDRRVSPAWQEKALGVRRAPAFLDEFTVQEQQQLLLSSLYYRASVNFKQKLARSIRQHGLKEVRQWFHTADAFVLPYLVTHDNWTYRQVDRLQRCALENCSQDYAGFQSHWKGLKKAMRKAFATTGHMESVTSPSPTVVGYLNLCRSKATWDGPASFGRYMLLWTQTRATGLANHVMVSRSVDQFVSTVQEPEEPVPVSTAILTETLGGLMGAQPQKAVLSVGTTSCLESTRKAGGKTAFLKRLANSRSLHAKYNWHTMERENIAPRPVRSAEDVLDWAIQTCMELPWYVRVVRLHTVVEPSKARTITVASYAYQVIMGVFAHVYQDTLKSRSVRSGLRSDRHLWRFLQSSLNPQNESWEHLTEGEVYGLSTDLSQATDFGNKKFASDTLDLCIRMTPWMPTMLSVLMKRLYTSARTVLVPTHGGYTVVKATRGWFMGDMMTKFMLTVAHDYMCRVSGLKVYTLVGDDEIALASRRDVLERHITNLGTLFKVSEDDTYISSFFAFYCEEGCILPQRASESNHVAMRRGVELGYLDYPRIRLMLNIQLETDLYSSTNSGRFALMGKEARWVSSTNPQAGAYFHRAGILQHLLLPQDRDCISPYTPLEIGGDGAFTDKWAFMRRVVDDKSADARETKFRLTKLQSGTVAYKFVRSSRLDKVVVKHHLMLPAATALKPYLPVDSVIDPKTDETRAMLRSFKTREIESPQVTFMRLARSYYYRSILQGKDPVEPIFKVDREWTHGHSTEPYVDWPQFIEQWKSPGFEFQEVDTYFVRRSRIEVADPMNVGMEPRWISKYPAAVDLFNDWLNTYAALEDTCAEDIISYITNDAPLPKRVVNRLNLFIESDSYILHELRKWKRIPRYIVLVSNDLKLGRRIVVWMDNSDKGVQHTVVCVNPAAYLVGMMDSLVGTMLQLGVRIEGNFDTIVDYGYDARGL